MAISREQLAWYDANGNLIPDATLHAIFGPGRVGSGDEYAQVYCRNNHGSFTLTLAKLWTAQDPNGGSFAVALGYSAAFAPGARITPLASTAAAYSSPTTKSSGIAVPDIPAGQQVLVYLRRNLVGATPSYPESSRVVLGGTSPI